MATIKDQTEVSQSIARRMMNSVLPVEAVEKGCGEQAKFFSSLNERVPKLDEILDKIEGIDEKTLLKSLISGTEWTDTILSLCLSLGQTLYHNTWVDWSFFCGHVALKVGLHTGVLSKILGAITSNPLPAPQAEEAYSKYMVMGISAVVMIVGFKFLDGDEITEEKKYKTLWEKLAHKSRELSNVERGAMSFASLFSGIQRMVCETLVYLGIVGADILKPEEYEFSEKMMKYATELKELERRRAEEELLIKPDSKAKMLECDKLRRELIYLSQTSKLGPEFRHKLSLTNKIHEDLMSALINSDKNTGSKVRPWHLSIWGQPQIGKTSLVYVVARVIAKFFDWPYDETLMYMKSGTSKYYDGYAGQKIHIDDDRDQVTDAEIVNESIKMLNSMAMQVNQADLSKKGMYYRSLLYMSTTNVLYPQPQVASHQAYQLRRDLLVAARPTQAFKDEAQLKAAGGDDFRVGIDYIRHSHLLFDIMNPSDSPVEDGVHSTEPAVYESNLTFEELLVKIIRKFAIHLEGQERFMMVNAVDFKGIEKRCPVMPVTLEQVNSVLSELIVDAKAKDILKEWNSTEERNKKAPTYKVTRTRTPNSNVQFREEVEIVTPQADAPGTSTKQVYLPDGWNKMPTYNVCYTPEYIYSIDDWTEADQYNAALEWKALYQLGYVNDNLMDLMQVIIAITPLTQREPEYDYATSRQRYIYRNADEGYMSFHATNWSVKDAVFKSASKKNKTGLSRPVNGTTFAGVETTPTPRQAEFYLNCLGANVHLAPTVEERTEDRRIMLRDAPGHLICSVADQRENQLKLDQMKQRVDKALQEVQEAEDDLMSLSADIFATPKAQRSEAGTIRTNLDDLLELEQSSEGLRVLQDGTPSNVLVNEEDIESIALMSFENVYGFKLLLKNGKSALAPLTEDLMVTYLAQITRLPSIISEEDKSEHLHTMKTRFHKMSRDALKELLTNPALRDKVAECDPVIKKEKVPLSEKTYTAVIGFRNKIRVRLPRVFWFSEDNSNIIEVVKQIPEQERKEFVAQCLSRKWWYPFKNTELANSLIGANLNGNVYVPFGLHCYAASYYHNILSGDFENAVFVNDEAQRVGGNLHSAYYTLQDYNNQMMNRQSGNLLNAPMILSRYIMEVFYFGWFSFKEILSVVFAFAFKMVKTVTTAAWSFVKEHPLISGLLAGVAIGLIVYKREAISNWWKGKKNPTVRMEGEEKIAAIQDHAHKDLPNDGHEYSHIHQCVICDAVFCHTHKKHPQYISERFRLVCQDCRGKHRSSSELGMMVETFEDEIDIVFEAQELAHPLGTTGEVRIERDVCEKDYAELESINLKGGSRPKNVRRKVVGEAENMLPLEKTYFMFKDLEVLANILKKTKSAIVTQPKTTEIKKPVNKTKTKTVQETEEEKVILPITPESCNVPNFADLQRRVCRNKVSANFDGQWADVTMLCERYALVFRHRFPTVLQTTRCTLIDWTTEHDFTFKVKLDDFIEFPTTDLGGERCEPDVILVRLDNKQIRAFPGIVKQFIRDQDLYRIFNHPGVLLRRTKNGEVERVMLSKITEDRARVNGGSGFMITNAIRYTCCSEPGYCGALIISLAPGLNQRIVGIHVAGIDETNDGLAQVVTYEMLMGVLPDDFTTPECEIQLMAKHDMILNEELDGNVDFHRPSYVPRNLDVMEVGYLKKPLNLPSKTKLRVSPLAKHIPYSTKMEPAVLTRNDPRVADEHQGWPGDKAFLKWKRTGGWNQEMVENSFDHYLQDVMKIAHKEGCGFEPRILTEYEAINGIQHLIKPLDMDTACGFPLENWRAGRGKTEPGKKFLFTEIGKTPEGQTLYEAGPELRKELDYIEKVVVEDHYFPNSFIKDTLKDEKRIRQKIVENATRLFNVCHTASLIWVKRISGMFTTIILHAKWRLDSTIGIDVTGKDPSDFIKYLREISDNFVEGDFKAWDGTVDPEHMQGFLEMVHKFNIKMGIYTSAKQRILGRGVLLSLVFRYHIYRNVVYFIWWGMASGVFLTAIGNTVVHAARDRTVWQVIFSNLYQQNYILAMMADALEKKRLQEEAAEALEMLPLSSFKKNFRTGNNGDDKAATVSEKARKHFNPVSFERVYKEKGITYTPPDKLSVISGVDGIKTLAQLRFLKSGFRQDSRFKRMIHMSMDKDVILDLPMWYRRSSTTTERLVESNVRDALSFAYHHGKTFYEEYEKIWKKACEQANMPFPDLTFAECDQRFTSKFGLFNISL